MEIVQNCTRCNGTGQIDPYGEPPGETECPNCGGNGIHEWGASPDILKKLNDIMDKCNDIFEKLNE